MSHIPPRGYEEAVFFGHRSHSCIRPEDGSTPYEAAQKHLELIKARGTDAYLIEEDGGWMIYARFEHDLPPKIERVLLEWLAEPIHLKIARWRARGKWRGDKG